MTCQALKGRYIRSMYRPFRAKIQTNQSWGVAPGWYVSPFQGHFNINILYYKSISAKVFQLHQVYLYHLIH